MTRCSHVTSFRSSLLNTQTMNRGSDQRCQYFCTVIISARLFICIAPSPTSATAGAVTPSTSAERSTVQDPGGAGPDEAIADAAEAPHPVSTPDEPAEVVEIDPDTKS